jgi:hypothetical protein
MGDRDQAFNSKSQLPVGSHHCWVRPMLCWVVFVQAEIELSPEYVPLNVLTMAKNIYYDGNAV